MRVTMCGSRCEGGLSMMAPGPVDTSTPPCVLSDCVVGMIEGCGRLRLHRVSLSLPRSW